MHLTYLITAIILRPPPPLPLLALELSDELSLGCKPHIGVKPQRSPLSLYVNHFIYKYVSEQQGKDHNGQMSTGPACSTEDERIVYLEMTG